MNILVVEDDENKRKHLVTFLSEALPSANVSVAKSLQSGLRSIIVGGVDLIILDMTMPTYDISSNESGGRPQPYAGRDILRQMERRGIETPVIIVTQFEKFGEGSDALTREELEAQLQQSSSASYQGMVYYNVALEGWKDALGKLISKPFPPQGDHSC